MLTCTSDVCTGKAVNHLRQLSDGTHGTWNIWYHMVIIWFSVFSFWKTWTFSKTLDVCLTSTVHKNRCALGKSPCFFHGFFLLEVIYKSSVERARMKSSAKSSAKAPTSTNRRRRQLDYLDYLQSQFPLSLCPLKSESDRIRFQHFMIFYHLSLPWVNSAWFSQWP